MAYTSPVTDRDQADIDALNSKAYFNVADWTRIYDNAEHVNGLFTSVLGYPISFVTLDTPTTATIPTVTAFNTLMENINRMSAWAAEYAAAPIVGTLKGDWQAGAGMQSPNYADVNTWESIIDVLYVLLSSWTPPAISGNLDLGGGGSLELGGGGYLELGA